MKKWKNLGKNITATCHPFMPSEKYPQFDSSCSASLNDNLKCFVQTNFSWCWNVDYAARLSVSFSRLIKVAPLLQPRLQDITRCRKDMTHLSIEKVFTSTSASLLPLMCSDKGVHDRIVCCNGAQGLHPWKRATCNVIIILFYICTVN
jgi:hypothetical protein